MPDVLKRFERPNDLCLDMEKLRFLVVTKHMRFFQLKRSHTIDDEELNKRLSFEEYVKTHPGVTPSFSEPTLFLSEYTDPQRKAKVTYAVAKPVAVNKELTWKIQFAHEKRADTI